MGEQEDERPVPEPEEPGGEGRDDSADRDDGHEADGLDLARSLMRTTRGRPATSGRRAPGRGGTGTGRRRTGDDRRGTGAHPDDRDPQTVESTLSRLVAEHGWAPDLRAHGAFARWSEIVGPEVGAHSRPESFADGKLVVGTDSTAWATQLRLLAPTIVRRLNEELGHGSVTVIDVKGPTMPSWTRGRRSVRGARGPRDTYG
jgi:predicted nucleic acid-binding Zn ribbon protein